MSTNLHAHSQRILHNCAFRNLCRSHRYRRRRRRRRSSSISCIAIIPSGINCFIASVACLSIRREQLLYLRYMWDREGPGKAGDARECSSSSQLVYGLWQQLAMATGAQKPKVIKSTSTRYAATTLQLDKHSSRNSHTQA